MVTPAVLVIDDDLEVAESLARTLRDLGYPAYVETDPLLTEAALERHPDVQLALVDLRMERRNGLEVLLGIRLRRPGVGVILVTVINDLEHVIQALKGGAWNYLIKPVPVERLAQAVRSWFGSPQRLPPLDPDFSRFVTGAPQFGETFRRVRSWAGQDVPLLIQGETGTGKEIIAEIVHSLSPRCARPFIGVNVAGLAQSLFESELFGHRQGAFTGAGTDHHGWIGAAGDGTLFLDEIGEINSDQQAKLLRMLQNRTYSRVGEATSRPLTCRLVFATSRDLRQEVAAGRFRSELLYRLSSCTIELPPLRERPGDIEVLACHFVRKYASQYGRPIEGIHADAMTLLREHPFPGNVRELENMLSGAILIECTPLVRPDSLPRYLRPVKTPPHGLEALRHEAILKALAECAGNQTQAAEKLGISRVTLNRLLKQHRDKTSSA